MKFCIEKEEQAHVGKMQHADVFFFPKYKNIKQVSSNDHDNIQWTCMCIE